jgi:hypothetical protein
MTDVDFTMLRTDVTEIKEALLGNALKGKLGVLHHHNQMYADLYGIAAHGEKSDSSVHNSILSRMSQVEDNQKKLVWMGAGIGAGAATVWAVILKFIGK